MHRIFFLILALFPLAGLTAQTLFSVRVGTFKDVKSDDFAEIQDLGFISGVSRDGNLTDVFIGNYSSEEKAQTVVTQLTAKGFRNSSVQRQVLLGSREETFVQIALRGRNRAFDWSAVQSAGPLYVEASDAVVKVLTGPFTDDAQANQALAKVREMGYKDAFTKKVDVAKLIPVGVFETGIKKPLIPIELTAGAPVTAAKPDPASPVDTAPVTPPVVAPPAPTTSTPKPTPKPAAASIGEEQLATDEDSAPAPKLKVAADLPEIDVKTKRHSAAELQRVLKEKGYYDSSIDGFYGKGTQSGYEAAWQRMPELAKYRTLADALPRAGTNPQNWPEMRVLVTVAEDLAAGLGNANTEREMAAGREKLLNTDTPITAKQSQKALDWEESTWTSLNVWATQDPLHARMLTALRVSYFQSQARLEAMYLGEGMTALQARDTATAALENLLRGPLDRFL